MKWPPPTAQPTVCIPPKFAEKTKAMKWEGVHSRCGPLGAEAERVRVWTLRKEKRKEKAGKEAPKLR